MTINQRRLRVMQAAKTATREQLTTLRQQHERNTEVLSTLVSTVHMAVIVTDIQRRIVMANTLAETYFAAGRASLVGQLLIAAVHDHEIDELLRRCLAGVPPSKPLTLDTSGRRLQVWGSNITAEDGHIWGGMVLVADISELHHLRTVRRDFVANISHELRTPLTTLRLLLETLQNGALDDPEMAERFLGQMDMETQQLIGLVEQLLELSRIEAGQEVLDRRPTPLRHLVASILERESSAGRPAAGHVAQRCGRDTPPGVG